MNIQTLISIDLYALRKLTQERPGNFFLPDRTQLLLFLDGDHLVIGAYIGQPTTSSLGVLLGVYFTDPRTPGPGR